MVRLNVMWYPSDSGSSGMFRSATVTVYSSRTVIPAMKSRTLTQRFSNSEAWRGLGEM